MDESVDIYAKFLGIGPGRRPPDYYALLGIAPTESEARRIHSAARRQIARLSAHMSGDEARVAQRLMVEIATARAVLTTPTGKERYDAKLREQPDFVPNAVPVPAAIVEDLLALKGPTAAAPPAPAAALPPGIETPAARPAEVSRWANPVAEPPKPPDMQVAAPTAVKARLVAGPGTAFGNELPTVSPDDVPQLPPTAQPTPIDWHVEADGAGPARFAPIAAQRRTAAARSGAIKRERSQMAVILMLFCLMAAMGLGAGAVLVWQQRNGTLAAAPQPTSGETARGEPAKGATAAASAGTERNVTSRAPETQRASSGDRAFDARPRDRETVVDRQSSRSGVTSAVANDSGTAMKTQNASDMRGSEAMPRKNDTAPRETGDTAKAADDNSEQANSVRQSLKDARDALALGDLERVDELLDLALVEASSDRLRAEVADVRTLRASVGSFWNAVRESLKTVNSGTELEIDGDTIIVVEVSRDRDRLAVRSKGQNGNYQVRQLPADLATGLAVRWLDPDDVNSPAFVGAYLATTARQEYVARGRAMLEKAQAAGSDVARAVLDALE